MKTNPINRILGIDPGTATTGFGIIDATTSRIIETVDYGVISTPPELSDSKRLDILHQSLTQLITTYQPTIMAVEKLFFFRNTTTIITVAQARGVILLNAELHHLSLFEFTPLQIKQAITGYGKAPKAQMQAMVTQTLGLSSVPKPDDAADGLAVALCCQSSLAYLLQTQS